MWSAAITATLEAAINRYLALDPDTLIRLRELQGRVIAVQWRNTQQTLYFLPHDRGLQLLAHFEGVPDTLLTGNPLALAELGLGQDKSRTLFSGEVTIQGDTETGQRFQAILEAMDIDWEEHLSHILGDVAAHQLGRLSRRGLAQARQTGHTLQLNLSEYLQEEARLLPTRIEAENFSADMDRLRMDADRLTARVTRLQSRLAEYSGKKA